MFRLIRRIILILLILGVGYGIYWLIDRQLSKEDTDELVNDKIQENNIMTPSQDSGIVILPTESFGNYTESSGSGTDSAVLPTNISEPPLGDPSEILTEKSIVVQDPIIQDPTKTTIVKPVVTPKPVQKTTVKKTSSSNILFLLFK